jgi:hypothetical protein
VTETFLRPTELADDERHDVPSSSVVGKVHHPRDQHIGLPIASPPPVTCAGRPQPWSREAAEEVGEVAEVEGVVGALVPNTGAHGAPTSGSRSNAHGLGG